MKKIFVAIGILLVSGVGSANSMEDRHYKTVEGLDVNVTKLDAILSEDLGASVYSEISWDFNPVVMIGSMTGGYIKAYRIHLLIDGKYHSDCELLFLMNAKYISLVECSDNEAAVSTPQIKFKDVGIPDLPQELPAFGMMFN